MAGYRVPSLSQAYQFMIGYARTLLQNRNLGSRSSLYSILINVISAAMTDNNAHIDNVGDQVMPDRTSGPTLDRWLAIVGTQRKGATPARKSAAGRVRGSVGAAYTLGRQLSHAPTGLVFQLNASGAIPAAGFVDVDIVAVSTGSATRLAAKEVLTFIAQPANIQSSVELQLALDEDGTDGEVDGAGVNRLLSITGTPSAGGNQGDYVNWLLALAGVNAAYCYPNRAGNGSVDLAVLHPGTGTSRYFTDGERAVVLAAIQAVAPTQVGGVGGALRVLKTTPELAHVEMTITTDGTVSAAWDWDDTTVPVVLAWNASTLTMQFSAARPATMKAGDRICILPVNTSVTPEDGAPIIINALSGTDSIVLAAAPQKPGGGIATPTAGDKVYAGGQLTDTIRAAIFALINSDSIFAGPSGPLPGASAASQGISTTQLKLLLSGIGTANPGGIYGSWNGELTITALNTIAAATRGVRKAAVLRPVTDQGSTDYVFPLDGQIGVLAPGYVIVRRG